MYAIVDVGGKQAKATEGEVLLVERLKAEAGQKVELRPVMFVDGDEVYCTQDELSAIKVLAEVEAEVLGPKVVGFVYKSKANERRRYGHRQRYTRVRVTGIEKQA
jgi:large subunit ribosomal protein L21